MSAGRERRFLREEPDRSIFEGKVLRIEHETGVEWDVQNGGWLGQPPDTWLSEHVLRRFEGKRVRVTVEVLDDIETDKAERIANVAREGPDGHA